MHVQMTAVFCVASLIHEQTPIWWVVSGNQIVCACVNTPETTLQLLNGAKQTQIALQLSPSACCNCVLVRSQSKQSFLSIYLAMPVFLYQPEHHCEQIIVETLFANFYAENICFPSVWVLRLKPNLISVELWRGATLLCTQYLSHGASPNEGLNGRNLTSW